MGIKISLEAARINAGYNQKTAAKELHISPSTLGKYEAGTAYPKWDLINKIEKLYKIKKDNIRWK